MITRHSTILPPTRRHAVAGTQHGGDWRVRSAALVAFAVVLSLIAAAFTIGAFTGNTAPTRVLGPAGAVVDSQLPGLQPPASPALASKTQDGFTVEIHQAMPSATGDFVIFYRVRVEGDGAFGDMLGIPRIVNPDGSLVLPREYGAAGSVGDGLGGIPGLPAASQAAVFESAQVQPGALFRAGPFFRSSEVPFALTTTGEALAAGFQTQIGGLPFCVTAVEPGGGPTARERVNTGPGATVVATHPGSRVSVLVDGKELPEVHGSTSFAKTVGYEVNANHSTIDVAGLIPPRATVSIDSSSIGHIHRGAWDFPLD